MGMMEYFALFLIKDEDVGFCQLHFKNILHFFHLHFTVIFLGLTTF